MQGDSCIKGCFIARLYTQNKREITQTYPVFEWDSDPQNQSLSCLIHCHCGRLQSRAWRWADHSSCAGVCDVIVGFTWCGVSCLQIGAQSLPESFPLSLATGSTRKQSRSSWWCQRTKRSHTAVGCARYWGMSWLRWRIQCNWMLLPFHRPLPSSWTEVCLKQSYLT